MSVPTWTSGRRVPDGWHVWFSADGDTVIPRRLRRAAAPKPPMYVIECDRYVTPEFAERLNMQWRIARATRAPLPLVMGPGLTVKEIKR